MLRSYIDESERDDKYYFMGAIVGTISQINKLENALENLAIELSVKAKLNNYLEFHGSEMWNPKSKSNWHKINIPDRISAFNQVATYVHESGVSYYMQGIDIQAHKNKNYRNIILPRTLSFQWLLEKIDDHAKRYQMKSVIFLDKHKNESIDREEFEFYKNKSTLGWDGRQVKNIEGELIYVDSHTSRALQACDLVTFIFNRKKTIVETDPRLGMFKAKVCEILEPCSIHPRGQRKIWP